EKYSKLLILRCGAGEDGGAADEFPRWVFAAGRRLAGLVRRREAERALFLS
ncbi:MAG: lysozyme, partial [Pseudomonadota bacterium]|nr:lysozyme [Pseudomonadota bacterium]